MESLVEVLAIVMKNALDSMGGADEEVHGDTSLMDAGLDSLASVGFRNSLIKDLGGAVRSPRPA